MDLENMQAKVYFLTHDMIALDTKKHILQRSVQNLAKLEKEYDQAAEEAKQRLLAVQSSTMAFSEGGVEAPGGLVIIRLDKADDIVQDFINGTFVQCTSSYQR